MKTITTLIIQAISLWILISIFVPLSPGMPTEGLDPSWAFGLNEAVRQHLNFGKEIIFTFGPYASIFTRVFDPVTDTAMVVGALYLAISYWAGLLVATRPLSLCGLLIFPIILAAAVYSRDALFFSYPLVVAFSCLSIVSSWEKDMSSKIRATLMVFFLFFPFGFYPLIKGSLLILCGIMAVICALFFLITKEKRLAFVSLLAPIVSTLLFWSIAGQSLSYLPDYISQTIIVTQNYTESMAKRGNYNDIFIYILASSILLIVILVQKTLSKEYKFLLLVAISFFLFVSFKGAFVRHDGHAMIAGASILIAATLVTCTVESKITYISILFAAISWFYINKNYTDISTERLLSNVKAIHSESWHGIKNRLSNKDRLINNYRTALSLLKEKSSFPTLTGTTDIYSHNQSYLISSGNSWNPRPIFQSYVAYSPALAYINRNHLLGSRAPDNIIFKVEPIDGRAPPLEDGASWPELLKNYQLTSVENNFLFLRKRHFANEAQNLLTIHTDTYLLGEKIQIPETKKMLFAEVDILPNRRGKILNTLFKTSQLYLEIDFVNGIRKRYRMISTMAKSGFLLSPFIESTTEFGLLYGEKKYLSEKRVKSFKIVTDSLAEQKLWENNYVLTLKVFDPPEPQNVSNLFRFNSFVEFPPNWVISTAKTCHEHIDRLNDAPPTTHISISTLLKIQGWLSPSARAKVMPDSIYVVLTDNQGKRMFFDTNRIERPDVAKHYGNPNMSASGYISTIDVSNINGDYILSLGFKEENGHIKICPAYSIHTDITRG